eukprot:GFUD01068530.1.p1 GENE.GFUD01068530.1~~GFUD01068530.1.p1  ORF type:complete len:124 (+),score=1.72 GFUD01068530.1:81-452(+)
MSYLPHSHGVLCERVTLGTLVCLLLSLVPLGVVHDPRHGKLGVEHQAGCAGTHQRVELVRSHFLQLGGFLLHTESWADAFSPWSCPGPFLGLKLLLDSLAMAYLSCTSTWILLALWLLSMVLR